MILCPCHSNNTYELCCKPYHDGLPAENAVKLMRSRYSAYSLPLPSYILVTTHPKNSDYKTTVKRRKKEILDFHKNTEFKDLEILDFEEDGELAFVTFKAHLLQNGKDASYIEKSRFEKVKGRWLYVSGELAEAKA